MNSDIKNKIHHLVDEIEDEQLLNMVMEDIEFYAKSSDIIDDLSASQLSELDASIKEADKNETMSWNELKKEMNEWVKKL